MLSRVVQCSTVLRPLAKCMTWRNSTLSVFPSSKIVRNKWLWGKDADGPEVSVGTKCGAEDDPVVNTSDKPYLGEPDEPQLKMFYYREAPPQGTLKLERFLLTLTSGLMWGWFVYHLYYNYEELIGGHHYIPAPEEFSDEELGIPPDDAPDPEYWGDHPMSRGMAL